MRVSEALNSLEKYFSQKGIESPKTDAEVLLSFILKCKRLELFLNYDRLLSPQQVDQLRACSIRRGRREPLQYIIGSVEFYGQTIKVDHRVLIPRPETEELIYQLQQYFSTKAPKNGLDLGTGSGAIAIALTSLYPTLQMMSVDKSSRALEVAYDNAVTNCVSERVRFICSSWFQNISETFDFIVSNPPYLTEEEVHTAQPEVRLFEPVEALLAQDHGLADLKKILSEAREHLNPGGVLVLETGLNQHATLTEWAQQLGYKKIKSTLDLSHRERYFWTWVDTV